MGLNQAADLIMALKTHTLHSKSYIFFLLRICELPT